MKSLASALVASLLISASAAAQTFVQSYQTKAKKASDEIKSSGLNTDLRQSFQARLQKINEDLCGRGSEIERFLASPGVATCPGITATKVEDANSAVDTLLDDLAAAKRDDGSKNQAAIYQPKLDALKQKVTSSAIDKGDQKALLDRIAHFNDAAPNGIPSAAGKGAASAADRLEDKFQKLSDDVDAAIALAKDKADAAGFAKNFESKVSALREKIKSSKLVPQIKQDFQKQLSDIESAACEPAVAKRPEPGAADSAREGKSCRGTPSAIEKGDDAVATLSDSVDEAIKEDGAKSLSDIYKPKLDALNAKLAAASIDKADLAALKKRISDFAASLNDQKTGFRGGAVNSGIPGKGAAAGKKKDKEDAVEIAADTYSKLSDDVDAAVALSQQNKDAAGFYVDLQKQLSALDAKVAGSKLDAAFKADFTQRAKQIVASLCPSAASKTGYDTKGCANATPSQISSAQTALQKLSDDVDAAVTAYGTESLADLYKPKLEALKAQLKASTVTEINKKPLLDRIGNFNEDVKSGRGGRAATHEDAVQKASDLYTALASDVAAAIKLSPMSAPDAKALLVKTTTLKATVDAAKAKITAKALADLDKRLLALQAQLSKAPAPNYDDGNDAYNSINGDYQSALAAGPAGNQ